MREKIVLLNYTGNEDNWGCQATSKQLLKLLRRFNDFIEVYRVEIFSSEKKSLTFFDDLFIRFKLKLINNKIFETNVLLIKILKFILFNISLNRMKYKNLNTCKKVILNGEGSIHGNSKNSISLFFDVWLSKKIFNKEVIVVNHTLQFDNSQSKRLIKKAYNNIDKFIIREPYSLENIKEIGINNVNIAGDAAFLEESCSNDMLNAILKSNNLEKNNYICISGSATLEKMSLNKHIDLLNEISRNFKVPIVLFASTNIDRRRMKELKKNIPELILFDNYRYEYKEIIGVIKNCLIHLTGRFHPMIFSIITSTPFVAYHSNTIKMNGVLNMIDYPLEAIDLYNMDSNKIIKKLQYVLNNQRSISNDLSNKTKIINDNIIETYKNVI